MPSLVAHARLLDDIAGIESIFRAGWNVSLHPAEGQPVGRYVAAKHEQAGGGLLARQTLWLEQLGVMLRIQRL